MFFYESDNSGTDDYYKAYPLQNFSFPLHFHQSYELIHVVEGVLSLTLNENSYTMEAGETAFIFPNQLHAFSSGCSALITVVLFSPNLIGHFSTHYRNMLPEHAVLPISLPAVKQLQFSNFYRKKAFLYEVFASLLEHTAFRPISPSDLHQSPLHQVLLYIDDHYQENCSLASVASCLGYDYTYLSRMFKEKISISFTDYLNQYRINQACRLLSNTSESISSIALQCGYDTIRSFNRNFLKVLGMTPRQYRDSKE